MPFRLRPRPTWLIAVGAISLLAAGCGGGGGSPGVANVSSSSTTATTAAQRGLVAFSACMRANGLPTFPDPRTGAGGNVKVMLHGLDASRARVGAAMTACRHLLPAGASVTRESPRRLRILIADGLSFASCMRSHGVSRFPDPSAQGQLSVAMVQAHGIDVHSQAVLHVVAECLPASHGALTPAKVREALQNAHR